MINHYPECSAAECAIGSISCQSRSCDNAECVGCKGTREVLTHLQSKHKSTCYKHIFEVTYTYQNASPAVPSVREAHSEQGKTIWARESQSANTTYCILFNGWII
jgi:hypothetical protein